MRFVHLFCTLFLLAICSLCRAQKDASLPQMTPEESAIKHTEMLVRELNIRDSVQRDTLYRLNLKYARLRAVSNTRAENLQRLQQLTDELQHILTPEQFTQFMNRQVDPSPRHPQQTMGKVPNTRNERH